MLFTANSSPAKRPVSAGTSSHIIGTTGDYAFPVRLVETIKRLDGVTQRVLGPRPIEEDAKGEHENPGPSGEPSSGLSAQLRGQVARDSDNGRHTALGAPNMPMAVARSDAVAVLVLAARVACLTMALSIVLSNNLVLHVLLTKVILSALLDRAKRQRLGRLTPRSE